jgi:hypothetical protein
LRGCRPDDSVALRIEGDDANRCPVSGLPAPTPWVAVPRILIDRVAGAEHGAILPGMTLRRGDVPDEGIASVVR